jgi:cysteinyl-tRNA synthetase
MALNLSAALSGGFDLSDWTITLPVYSTGGSLSGTLAVDAAPGQGGDSGTLSFTNSRTGETSQIKFAFEAANGPTHKISLNETFSFLITAKGNTLDVDLSAYGKQYKSITPINDVWQSNKISFTPGVSTAANAGSSAGMAQTSFNDLVPQSGTLAAAAAAPAPKSAASPQAATSKLTGTNKSVIYALQDVKASDLTNLSYQISVIDADGGFSKSQIAQMGGGAADKRQLLAYVSAGEAEPYRDYWKSSWNSNPPAWLGPKNPEWGSSYVRFWDPAWKAIVKGRIKEAVDAGFDGVFFDVVDVYERAWVQQGTANAKSAMIAFVKEMSAYAKGLKSGFKIHVNNAEPLLADKSYLAAIDGVLKESLYYTGNTKNSASDTAWSTKYLDMAKAAGKNVSVIDYISDPAKIADMHAKAAADGYGYYTSNRDLKGVSKTSFSTFSQPSTSVEKASDAILGTSGANKLTGTSGADRIDGKSGNDMLWGKSGNDVLISGTGRDTFTFDTKLSSKNVDKIIDFNVTYDTIRLNDSVFTKLKTGKLSTSSFVAGTKASDSSDRIIYDKKTGALSYDADGSGSKAAVKFAVIENHAKLTAADFFII